MKFNDLAWAALFHHYKSGGDRKYVKLFRDTAFISKLRQTPWDVPHEEFETKVISGFVNSIGLRQPVERRSANPLAEIIKLAFGIENVNSKKVQETWIDMIDAFGSEVKVLVDVPVELISQVDEKVGVKINSFRKGLVLYISGGGGNYGTPVICESEKELDEMKKKLKQKMECESALAGQKMLSEY